MALSENDVKKAQNKIKKLEKLLKTLGTPNNPELPGVGISAIIEKLMPFIPLHDKGKSRGKLVGILKQLRQTIPETIVRDKSRIADREQKEENAALSKGIQDGLNTRNNRAKFRVTLEMTKPDHQKMRQALGNSLKKALSPKLRELFKRKLK